MALYQLGFSAFCNLTNHRGLKSTLTLTQIFEKNAKNDFGQSF